MRESSTCIKRTFSCVAKRPLISAVPAVRTFRSRRCSGRRSGCPGSGVGQRLPRVSSRFAGTHPWLHSAAPAGLGDCGGTSSTGFVPLRRDSPVAKFRPPASFELWFDTSHGLATSRDVIPPAARGRLAFRSQKTGDRRQDTEDGRQETGDRTPARRDLAGSTF